MSRPFISVVCSEESWGDVLDHVREQFRFSRPDQYIQSLLDCCGRPLLVSTEFADFHIYPPMRGIPKSQSNVGLAENPDGS